MINNEWFYTIIYIINGLFKCLINKLLYLIKMLFNNCLSTHQLKRKIMRHYWDYSIPMPCVILFSLSEIQFIKSMFCCLKKLYNALFLKIHSSKGTTIKL